MPERFIISDTHFGHQGVCEFLRDDGVTKLRPFATAEEMDEHLIDRWNSRVGVRDKIYHLGDVAISRRALATLARLRGDKVLIKGNHDIYQLREYHQYFRDVRAYHVQDGLIMSHIPVHDSALYRFGANIHGHLHARRVTLADGVTVDPRYLSVCVEQTDWAPLSWDEALDRIRAQGGVVGFRNGNGPQAD